jgi:hypothetical protein
MENNLDKTNFEITKKLEQIEREKYTKRYNNINYVDFSNPNADKISSASTTSMKKETLEEVAERLYPRQKPNSYYGNIELLEQEAFEQGAKWQSERMYSEEDLRNAFDSAREFDSLDGIVDVHIVLPMGGDMSDLQPLHFTFKEWFKQFKKK